MTMIWRQLLVRGAHYLCLHVVMWPVTESSSSVAKLEALNHRLLNLKGNDDTPRQSHGIEGKFEIDGSRIKLSIEAADSASDMDVDTSDKLAGASTGTSGFLRQINASGASHPGGMSTMRFPSHFNDDDSTCLVHNIRQDIDFRS